MPEYLIYALIGIAIVIVAIIVGAKWGTKIVAREWYREKLRFLARFDDNDKTEN